jgi:hypothetical protein
MFVTGFSSFPRSLAFAERKWINRCVIQNASNRCSLMYVGNHPHSSHAPVGQTNKIDCDKKKVDSGRGQNGLGNHVTLRTLHFAAVRAFLCGALVGHGGSVGNFKFELPAVFEKFRYPHSRNVRDFWRADASETFLSLLPANVCKNKKVYPQRRM